MNYASTRSRLKAAIVGAAMLAGTISTPFALVPFTTVTAAGKTVKVNESFTCKESDNTYTVKTASLCGADDTLESITCEFSTTYSSGSFSGGLGIGVTKDYSPEYWYQGDSFDQKFTSSKFKVTYEVPKDVQPYVNMTATTNIGMYYCGNSAVTGSVTLLSVTGNVKGGSIGDEDPESTAKKSGSYSFVDNKDGTATISSTLTAAVNDLDVTLTQGKDEEYYLDEDGLSTYEPGDPINSHKITYSDFGISQLTNVTLESFSFILESSGDMGTVMYGGGMNVEHESLADTEFTAGKNGYWYNDHGSEDETDYGFEVGHGTTLEDVGEYVEAVWTMPDEVRPFATTNGSDAVSIQYWYGTEDEIKLTGATCTYTQTVTVPYTGSTKLPVGNTLEMGSKTDNTTKISFADLELGDTDELQAILFTVSAKTDIKKFVGGIGYTAAPEMDVDWIQLDDIVILDAADEVTLMWIIPENRKKNIDTKYGDLMLGYWYGESDTVTLDSIEAYYYTAPVVTTTTTTTTTMTTTTMLKPLASMYGDVNCDESITIADLVLLARYVAEDDEMKPLSKTGVANADCAYDEKVNSSDITALARYLAHIITANELGRQF